jgi:DNA helicase-2/ATP-dependent DNA helicase PcrA
LSSILIKKYEDLNYLQRLGVVDFSYSRVDTYNQCPAKYFYSYILKEPRQFNAPAALGNIVHTVLENVLDNEKVLDLEELQREYVTSIESWDPDNLISKDLITVGSSILEEFYDQNIDKNFNIYEKEMSFSFIIGIYRIIGFIDRVDVIGDRVNITDYKTGKWEVALKNVPENLQLGIYALALHNIFPEKEIYAELYYLRSGKRKGHLFTEEDIEDVKIRLINSINLIINDKNFLPTSNPRTCSYCDHAKSGACGTGVYRNNK